MERVRLTHPADPPDKPKIARVRTKSKYKPRPPKPKRSPMKPTTPTDTKGKFGGNHSRSPRRRLTMATIRELDAENPGKFPHQMLLEICRTGYVYPSHKKRIDAELYIKVLGMAAPYFAPRMASVHLRNDPPFLNADLAKLSGMDPAKLAIANEVLQRLYGTEFKDKPILDLQRLVPTGDGEDPDAPEGNVYGETLDAERGDDE